MNRTQRILSQARHTLGWMLVSLSACVAGCVWLVNVNPLSASGGALVVLTLASLCATITTGRETIRLYRLYDDAKFYSLIRGIRPRL